MTALNISKSFSLKGRKPRDVQAQAIRDIHDKFEGGAGYVVLEGPPGVGKSAIATTLANHYGKTVICTLTAQLQRQYEADFSYLGAKTLLGRGKFECKRAKATCAVGKILYSKGDACYGPNLVGAPMGNPRFPCPYLHARQEALGAPIMLANYHSFLHNVAKPAMLRGDDDETGMGPDLLVLDEAHGIESILLDEISVSIRLDQLSLAVPALPPPDGEVKLYFQWLEELLQLLRVQYKDLVDPEEKEKCQRLASKIKFAISVSTKESWIVERGQNDDGSFNPNWFSLKPLTVKSFGHWLWGHSPRVLLMSATILSPFTFVTSLGLDPAGGDFIQLPCTFPAENRPVFAGSFNMKKDARDESWPRMVRAVENILRHHSKEKGLLLTPSNQMIKYIREQLPFELGRRVIVAAGEDRIEKYQEHLRSREPTVLAMSNGWEGIDLKDNACYDSETEILTEIGWVEFPKLNDDTKVAAYNAQTGVIQFERAERVTRTTARDWVEFDTTTNNLMVTANHRMLWMSHRDTVLEKLATDPPTHHYGFVCAGLAGGECAPLSDDQIRLAVAVQADGHWLQTGSTSFVRVGLRRSDKIERMRELLAKLQVPFTEQANRRKDSLFKIPKSALLPMQILCDWEGGKRWKVEALLALGFEQRRVFMSELVHWDGSAKVGESVSYASSNPANIDAVQAVAAITDYRSMFTGHAVRWYSGRKPLALFVNTENNYIKKTYPIEMPAYCVTVSTGWVIVRRRGKVTVSGNSRFQIIPQLPRPFWAGQVKARAEVDRGWYQWRTWCRLIQGLGRSVRTETDSAVSYVLDGEFKAEVFKEKGSLVPQWLRDAVVVPEAKKAAATDEGA